MRAIPNLEADRLVKKLCGIMGDLTARQLGVFLTCYLRDEPQTVRGLAARLQIEKAVVTRCLDRLEELKLAARKPEPRDRRSVIVQHTAKGADFLRDLMAIMAQTAAEIAKRQPLQRNLSRTASRIKPPPVRDDHETSE